MESGRVVEYNDVYHVFSDPQTAVAQRFVQTTLRNEPDQVESESLLAEDGRLFTIELTEHSGFFDAVGDARAAGVGIGIVHGGVTTLKEHSFGKITVRLTGPDDAINSFAERLSHTTEISEIDRDEVARQALGGNR